jgi:hypothetical protein
MLGADGHLSPCYLVKAPKATTGRSEEVNNANAAVNSDHP